jgi:hypothetical protein
VCFVASMTSQTPRRECQVPVSRRDAAALVTEVALPVARLITPAAAQVPAASCRSTAVLHLLPRFKMDRWVGEWVD